MILGRTLSFLSCRAYGKFGLPKSASGNAMSIEARRGAHMTAVILLALWTSQRLAGRGGLRREGYLAVRQAEIMIRSSIRPSFTSPVAVDWTMKTSSSRTDSPTVKEVSWLE